MDVIHRKQRAHVTQMLDILVPVIHRKQLVVVIQTLDIHADAILKKLLALVILTQVILALVMVINKLVPLKIIKKEIIINDLWK